MTSRHYVILEGGSYTCDTCSKLIKEGEKVVIIVDDDEKLHFHPSCEPEKYRKNVTTIR